MTQRSDLELLERVTQSDEAAHRELFDRYHARVFAFALRRVRDESLAEEIVVDTFFEVWRRAETFRGDAAVSTWIFGIAYRQALKRLSKKQLTVVHEVDPADIADSSTRKLEQEDWVQHAIDALPAAQRLALYLVFYLGLSYEEVAEVSDCPVNTVKTRMFHARKKMKELLQ